MEEKKSNDLNFENYLNELIAEIIRKVDGEYCLYSKKINPKTGERRNLGCYPTKAGVRERERQVQYFKHSKE